MARYEESLQALTSFRLEVQRRTFRDIERIPASATASPRTLLSAFSTNGASYAFATPFTNIHATGAGIRVRRGRVMRDEFVLKVYVFQKLQLGDATPDIMKNFQNIEVDVEVSTCPIGGYAKVATQGSYQHRAGRGDSGDEDRKSRQNSANRGRSIDFTSWSSVRRHARLLCKGRVRWCRTGVRIEQQSCSRRCQQFDIWNSNCPVRPREPSNFGG